MLSSLHVCVSSPCAQRVLPFVHGARVTERQQRAHGLGAHLHQPSQAPALVPLRVSECSTTPLSHSFLQTVGMVTASGVARVGGGGTVWREGERQ